MVITFDLNSTFKKLLFLLYSSIVDYYFLDCKKRINLRVVVLRSKYQLNLCLLLISYNIISEYAANEILMQIIIHKCIAF